VIYPLDSTLEATVDEVKLLIADRDRRMQQDILLLCQDDPWFWLVNFVRTVQKDEFSNGGLPVVNLFPPIPYLRVVFDGMFRYRKLVVDKSRQMMLSWICMAYYLYWGLFGHHEQILIQTKKEEDAGNLVKRCFFMYDNLRRWMRPKHTYREGSGGRLSFPGRGSEIRGIPAGSGAADQIRSANPSRYFLDEGGFIDDFSGCRACAEACCQDIKIVSTPNVGAFADFIHDGSVEDAA
jgi:hypothetical protein